MEAQRLTHCFGELRVEAFSGLVQDKQLNIMSGEYVVQGVTLSHEIANKWKELFIGKVRIGSAVYPMRRYHMMRLLKDIEVTTER